MTLIDCSVPCSRWSDNGIICFQDFDSSFVYLLSSYQTFRDGVPGMVPGSQYVAGPARPACCEDRACPGRRYTSMECPGIYQSGGWCHCCKLNVLRFEMKQCMICCGLHHNRCMSTLRSDRYFGTCLCCDRKPRPRNFKRLQYDEEWERNVRLRSAH